MMTGPVLAAGPADPRHAASGRAPPRTRRSWAQRCTCPRSTTSTRCSTPATPSRSRSPPPRSPTLAIRAARAGKTLLLEKPLGDDVARRAAVVDAVAETGVGRARDARRTASIPRSRRSWPRPQRHRTDRRAGLLHLGRVPRRSVRARLAARTGRGARHRPARARHDRSRRWARSSRSQAAGDPLGWVSVELHARVGRDEQRLDVLHRRDRRPAAPRSRCTRPTGVAFYDARAVDRDARADRIRTDLVAVAGGAEHPANVGRALHLQRLIADIEAQLARLSTPQWARDARPRPSTICSRSSPAAPACTTSPSRRPVPRVAVRRGAAGVTSRRSRARGRRARARHRRHRVPARPRRPRGAAAPSSSSRCSAARVARLVGAHVDAKRYLVATDPAYRARLSPRSIETLHAAGRGARRRRGSPRWRPIPTSPRSSRCAAPTRRAKDPHARAARARHAGARCSNEVAAVSARRFRRRRRRRRAQRARRRRAARPPRRAGHRAGTPIAGRRRGDDRAAVGARVQRHRAVVRRQPDAADDRRRARAREARLQGVSAARLLRAVPRRPRAPAARRRSRPAGTPRSPGSRRPTPTRTSVGTRGSAASPTCSARCSRRFRRASARAAPATSSTSCGSRGGCAGSASTAPPTSRACSR